MRGEFVCAETYSLDGTMLKFLQLCRLIVAFPITYCHVSIASLSAFISSLSRRPSSFRTTAPFPTLEIWRCLMSDHVGDIQVSLSAWCRAHAVRRGEAATIYCIGLFCVDHVGGCMIFGLSTLLVNDVRHFQFYGISETMPLDPVRFALAIYLVTNID